MPLIWINKSMSSSLLTKCAVWLQKGVILGCWVGYYYIETLGYSFIKKTEMTLNQWVSFNIILLVPCFIFRKVWLKKTTNIWVLIRLLLDWKLMRFSHFIDRNDRYPAVNCINQTLLSWIISRNNIHTGIINI